MTLRYGEDGGTFTPEPAQPWSSLELADTGVLANFDVAADGKSAVALVAAGAERQPPRDHVTIVSGFFDEIRRATAAPP